MTTGWGAAEQRDWWAAPRTAWTLARETADGRGPAALKEIAREQRPDVIIAMGAQIRAFQADAALRGAGWEIEPAAWKTDVPHAAVRRLAADALSGECAVRVPERLCNKCLGAALAKMADALLDVMTAAGMPPAHLRAVLDWLASRAR